jgi:hypothetical protein
VSIELDFPALESVVTGVEVFALFKVLSQVVGFRGELSVEAEESLLVEGERLQVSFSKGS